MTQKFDAEIIQNVFVLDLAIALSWQAEQLHVLSERYSGVCWSTIGEVNMVLIDTIYNSIILAGLLQLVQILLLTLATLDLSTSFTLT